VATVKLDRRERERPRYSRPDRVCDTSLASAGSFGDTNTNNIATATGNNTIAEAGGGTTPGLRVGAGAQVVFGEQLANCGVSVNR
jgi:hypothetical protein